ncbi:hypothetical protein AFUB_028440 [Aspergillus fumigatus A1163]|uniref:Uncharacterized protein n=1 Tax=Aspergillus fumigatus (strain CBS 144.89 / FGSC A1163 / CEA10) TaxID=451804 RepID=B0XT06_ASPFC|nr:hypothetical protein AFUB_028440 [Aspergillus fumigatus A1163]
MTWAYPLPSHVSKESLPLRRRLFHLVALTAQEKSRINLLDVVREVEWSMREDNIAEQQELKRHGSDVLGHPQSPRPGQCPCCAFRRYYVFYLALLWHPTNVRRDNLLVRVCGNGHGRPADIGYLFLDKPYPVVMVIPLTEIDRDDKIYHQSAYPFTIPLHAAASARGITKLCQNLDTSLRGEAPAARGQ